MTGRPPYHRRGMSLVELLVVVAILGLLAVTVLPTIASTTESRRTREAARVTSSFIASAQSRALGRREWSGFQIVPAGTGNVAIDLTLVDVPPPYRGDVVGAQISIPMPGLNSTTLTGTAVGSVFAHAETLGVTRDTVIRFADRDPWYGITDINYEARTIAFQKRGAAGQSSTNTPWPPSGNQVFEIAMAPAPYGTGVTLGEGRVVDITWSGFYDTGNFTPFNAGPVTVLYDGTGRLRQLIHAGPSSPTGTPGPILFLVGRADRAGQLDPLTFSATDDTTGCNWQYSDSFWVMINPATGTVHQAACDPTATGVEASQSFVRAYLSAGGGS
jgi:prepilin-type N-terminal cleavage/methylation domain-containing protein